MQSGQVTGSSVHPSKERPALPQAFCDTSVLVFGKQKIWQLIVRHITDKCLSNTLGWDVLATHYCGVFCKDFGCGVFIVLLMYEAPEGDIAYYSFADAPMNLLCPSCGNTANYQRNDFVHSLHADGSSPRCQSA
jgi:hypothetical protein